ADVAVLVEACDVAGAQPTVGGELVGLLRDIVIAAGDEVAANLYLADALAIPRLLFVAFANDAQIDQRRGNAGSCRETDALLFVVVLQLRFHERATRKRARLRHAPALQHTHAVPREAANQRFRHSRAADDH